MTATPTGAPSYARRCAHALNSLHAIPYFTDDLAKELAPSGVTDPTGVYLASRVSPLGVVDAPVVTAVCNAFAPRFVAERIPALWEKVSPERAIEARLKTAGAALERLLGADVVRSEAMAEAAALAGVAASAGRFPGRPLFAANAALDVPGEPHLALWHAATLLREYRGEGHITALAHAELTGVHALVIDCASDLGMSKRIVMPQRGWTEEEWAAAEEELRERGLVDRDGALTARGTAVREEVERETNRLDRAPYALLGDADTERLALYVHGLVSAAGRAGAFIPQLLPFFAPDTDAWNKL
ncbi:SCO6745 family protein [Streptomyces albireticuli]|uniref:SCO6745 family protein n=1 Tax=Streptomyces albireticuli TaxID=1940 RepID=UPI00367D0978